MQEAGVPSVPNWGQMVRQSRVRDEKPRYQRIAITCRSTFSCLLVEAPLDQKHERIR
jgi:hypothetical protein